MLLQFLNYNGQVYPKRSFLSQKKNDEKEFPLRIFFHPNTIYKKMRSY